MQISSFLIFSSTFFIFGAASIPQYDMYSVYSTFDSFFLGGISYNDRNLTQLISLPASQPSFPGAYTSLNNILWYSTGNDPSIIQIDLATLKISKFSLPETSMIHSIDNYSPGTHTLILIRTSKKYAVELCLFDLDTQALKVIAPVPFTPYGAVPSAYDWVSQTFLAAHPDGLLLAISTASATSWTLDVQASSIEAIFWDPYSTTVSLLISDAYAAVAMRRVTSLATGATVPIGPPFPRDCAPYTSLYTIDEGEGIGSFLLKEGTALNLVAMNLSTGSIVRRVPLPTSNAYYALENAV